MKFIIIFILSGSSLFSSILDQEREEQERREAEEQMKISYEAEKLDVQILDMFFPFGFFGFPIANTFIRHDTNVTYINLSIAVVTGLFIWLHIFALDNCREGYRDDFSDTNYCRSEDGSTRYKKSFYHTKAERERLTAITVSSAWALGTIVVVVDYLMEKARLKEQYTSVVFNYDRKDKVTYLAFNKKF